MSSENIQRFLQEAYSDQNLVDLLVHLDAGKLSYYSCCCLRGVPKAPHALKGLETKKEYHLICTPLALAADQEFHALGWTENGGSDTLRSERLRPLVLAEMERREQERDYEDAEEYWTDADTTREMVNSIKGR